MAHSLPLTLGVTFTDAASLSAEYFPMTRPDGSGYPDESRVRLKVAGETFMPSCLSNRPVMLVVVGMAEDGAALYYGGCSYATAKRIARAENAHIVKVEQYPHAR